MPDLVLRGKAIKLGDNVSTDDIIPGRFAHLRSNILELAKHVFEDAAPAFASRARALSAAGERRAVLVAGKNVGLRSSRQHAPVVIKMSGVGLTVLALARWCSIRHAPPPDGSGVQLVDHPKVHRIDEEGDETA